MNKKMIKILASASIIPMLAYGQTFREAATGGTTSGQVRYYFMSTDNAPGLQDYYGSAIGGKLKYETQRYHNFTAGVALYTASFIDTNVKSSNTEPTAGNKKSRYVIGLVDARDPDNHNVTNVGELYLNYKYSKTAVTLGRMKLKTPFMNPEDGRMIGTLEQGVWIKSKDLKNFLLQAGYINAFWNRSTPGWKSVADSIGYGYGEGREPVSPAIAGKYYTNLSSDGLYVLSAKYMGVKHTTLQAWNYYAQNLFNLSYGEGHYGTKIGNYRFVTGLQYIYERAVGNGGNSNPTLTYMRPHEISQTYGAKIGAGYKESLLTFAWNHTTDAGRFMFPREWGKEPLYTFQKRERSEGSGGCRAWLVTLNQTFKGIGLNGLSAKIGFGEYFKPDVKDAVLNKYGLPSYAQSNIDITYHFQGSFKGLSAEYIFARKYALGNTYQTPANSNFVFNKVNLVVNNFVVNYNF